MRTIPKDNVVRLLAASLAFAGLVVWSSCGTVKNIAEKIHPHNYELEVKPTSTVASELQSLYFIVSPLREVEESLATKTKYGDLLDEQRMRKYVGSPGTELEFAL